MCRVFKLDASNDGWTDRYMCVHVYVEIHIKLIESYYYYYYIYYY